MTSDSDSESSTRKRLVPRWAKVLLVVGLPVLVLVIGWMALDISTGWKLEAVLADFRARGWPTELEDLFSAPIPDSENAAPLYARAFANAKTPSEETESLDSLEGWAALSAENKAKVRTDLAQNAEALELVHRAGQRRSCDFRLDYRGGYSIELPHLSQLRRSTRLERAALIVALTDGCTQEALGHWLDMVAMARHQEGQKLLICELVRRACLSMVYEASQALVQSRQLQADQVEAGLAALDGLDSQKSVLSGLQGELVLFRNFFEGGAGPHGLAELSSLANGPVLNGDLETVSDRLFILASAKVYDSPLGRPWRRYDEATGLALLGEGVELLGHPLYAERESLSRWQEKAETPPHNASLTRMLLPNFGRLGPVFASGEVWVACTRTALALERYRLTHGDYPATLDALVPDILLEVPLDPFDGRPLRYINSSERVAVYSVGENLTDDVGSEERAPSASVTKDIVFTLRPGPERDGGQKP